MTDSRSPHRPSRHPLRACSLALLALGLLAPATASAAHCGRYILSSERFDRDLARLFGDNGPAKPGQSPVLPLPPAAPCKGASCSAPPAAPTTPTAPASPRGEEWPCPAALLAVPPLDSRLRNADEADTRPVRHPLAIFHPPRHAAPSA